MLIDYIKNAGFITGIFLLYARDLFLYKILL